MTRSDLQRARLDLLIAYCGAVVQAEMKSEIDFGANLEYHRESMKDVFAPAFEYLETLEANADYGPLKACDICGGEIKAEWDKMHKAESCAGDIVKKVADLPPADRGEVTASIAPHFKKEISRVCVETGRPLSEWAIGTAIDSDGSIYEYADRPFYDGDEWLMSMRLGVVDLAGRDPSTTWREYPKAGK